MSAFAPVFMMFATLRTAREKPEITVLLVFPPIFILAADPAGPVLIPPEPTFPKVVLPPVELLEIVV